MKIFLFRAALLLLLAAAFCLIAFGFGDWASRTGSLIVTISLVSAYYRATKGVWNPKEGPVVFSGGGAADYTPSKEQINDHRKSVADLKWEFFGGAVGTILNGFAPWISCKLVEAGFSL